MALSADGTRLFVACANTNAVWVTDPGSLLELVGGNSQILLGQNGGGFNNLIGSLSTLGLLTKPAAGYVALSRWAQELLQH